jgi:PhnB protein
MKNLNAYLGFDGNCREAMNFYRDILGGELFLQTIEESPIASHFPPELRKGVLHSELKAGSISIMATDCVGPQGFSKGTNVSLCILCSSEEEIYELFSKFSPGGNITCPVQDMFWGDTFGTLADKFGINWMFVFDKSSPEAKVAKAKQVEVAVG